VATEAVTVASSHPPLFYPNRPFLFCVRGAQHGTFQCVKP
jgi:hypothetical protein